MSRNTHISRTRHRSARPRTRRDSSRHRGVARREGCAIRAQRHSSAAFARNRRPRSAFRQPSPSGVARRSWPADALEDHREHGTRAQRDARAVGLDERPGDPLHLVGVGRHRPVCALEADPQLPASQVHQRPRNGRRRRIRTPPRHPRSALEALQRRQPGLQHAARVILRVRHRRSAPRARQGGQGPRRQGRDAAQAP